ncbi:MAG: hypothetical protein Q7J12_00895 [Syntrophales bacterium]|nr:hypothetical protein [Syntrophales bacterium]
MDFWTGTFGLGLFALVETFLFVRVFGMENAWNEIAKGAQVPAPRFFYFVLKYVTPFYLLFLFLAWSIQQGPCVLLMKDVPPDCIAWRWAARIALLAVFAGLCYAASKSERLKGLLDEQREAPR